MGNKISYEIGVQMIQDNKMTHLEFIQAQDTCYIDYCNWLTRSNKMENEESAIEFLDYLDDEIMNGQ